MSDQLYPLLMSGDWRAMLEIAREWYTTHCPRYSRDDVETRLVFVGTLFLRLNEYEERCTLPYFDYLGQRDTDRFTPDQIEQMLRREIDDHYRHALQTYYRHCERHDNPEQPAEKKVEQVLRNIAAIKARRAAVTAV